MGDYADMRDPGPAYHALGTEGSLTARVVGALWWDRERGLEQIAELEERRATLGAGRFGATAVKIMQDGVAENFTAAMLSPYEDGHGHATSNDGISFVEPALLNEAVARLDALGFQVHFHAIGDRAARECLDAVQAARGANGPSDGRHHIAHLQVVHPEDIPRFAALGVTANMQALWATYEPQMTELTLPFLGEVRGAWQYPFGDLDRSCARLAAGSDWPVSSPDPIAAIHTAVNRWAPDEGEQDPFLAHQALSLRGALHAYTAGSAYVNHLDDVTGTVEVGKFADLAVLDRDPFAGPAGDIAAARVLQAFIEGERVGGYEDLRRYFGLKVQDPEATSYRPVAAVFLMAALLAVAAALGLGRPVAGVHTVEAFIAIAMCLLASAVWTALALRFGFNDAVFFGSLVAFCALALVPSPRNGAWAPVAGIACLTLGGLYGYRVSLDVQADRKLEVFANEMLNEAERVRRESGAFAG